MESKCSSQATRSNLKIRTGPSGIHLFNRLTGLNVLLDEIRVPSTMWARAPRHVSIALTNECDLECPYCFVPRRNAFLNYGNVLYWLSELDQNGCLGVGFGGGEPTLYPKLAEICAYTTHETGLAVTLATHAHNFNDKLVEELTGCVHFVRVSMDGVGSTYETLRGRSFDAFCSHLKYVRSIAPFGINYLVNSQTLSDLDDAIKFANDVGAAEFLLLPEISTKQSVGIDNDTNQALIKWVAQYQGTLRLAISETGSEGMPTCNPHVRDKGLQVYAHVDARGVLKRSSFDDKGVSISGYGIIRALQILDSTNREDTI